MAASGENPRKRLLGDTEDPTSVNYGGYVPIENDVSSSPEEPHWAFQLSIKLFAKAAWVSMIIFAFYIMNQYGGTMLMGKVKSWGPAFLGNPVSTAGIGLHFLTAPVILLLGNVQLIPAIRRKRPAVHRWLGRLYAAMSLLTALGGLVFILIHGCLGGTMMNIGFTMYGMLMVWMAIETVRHSRARRFDQHRAYALRLYSLAIASWLYRIDYAFWLIPGLPGHTLAFKGWFDWFMDFAFFVPNLIVVEYILHAERRKSTLQLQFGAAVMFTAFSFFVVYAAYYTWILPIFSIAGFNF